MNPFKIICLVKFTPDVDEFKYDHENNVLIRDGVKTIINPDDACALGFALALKKKNPEGIFIEVVSMGPESALPQMEEVLRRRIDKGTLICDPAFAGSDTLATSRILGKYLSQTDYDVILTGDHSVDGDTAHIPSQIAEYLDIPQISAVIKIDEESLLQGAPLVDVDNDIYSEVYELTLPGIISISRTSRIRLPFVRFADKEMDVSESLQVLSNRELNLSPEDIGLLGSPTRVVTTWTKSFEKNKEQHFVKNDEEGVEYVFNFLKEEGYLS